MHEKTILCNPLKTDTHAERSSITSWFLLDTEREPCENQLGWLPSWFTLAWAEKVGEPNCMLELQPVDGASRGPPECCRRE